jgi:hypothetical protein
VESDYLAASGIIAGKFDGGLDRSAAALGESGMAIAPQPFRMMAETFLASSSVSDW